MSKMPKSHEIFYDFFNDTDKDACVENLDKDLKDDTDILEDVREVLHQAVDDYIDSF